MVVMIFNNVDRFLPSILAEPMKRELGLSDTFLGVLNGVGFLVIYAVAGIPIAKVADRGRFGLVISACLAGWSLMTMLGGLVTSAWQLAVTRAGVALGEAGSSPASHAYISRNFTPERRAAALAVLTLGAPLGGMTGMIAGGMIGEALGWRRTFMLMGAIGLVLAPLVLLAIGRGQPLPKREAEPQAASLRGILRKPSVLALCAASGFISFGGYASGAFSPAFLMRVHGMSVGTVGLQLGLLNGALGMVTMLSLGWLGGRLGRLDPRWPLALLTGATLFSIPFGVAAYLFAEGSVALLCIALSNLVSTAYLALTVACLHSLVPVEVRARSSAILLFWTAMMGGLGPLLAGMISDALTPTLGAEALGRALLIVPAGLVMAALSFVVAAAHIRRDMIAEAAD